MDSVVVYTNKQADRSAKYSTYYAVEEKTVDEDGFTWVARNNVVTGVDDDGVIDLAEDMVADAAKLISAAMFPSGNGSGTTYPHDDDDADEVFKVEFAGAFHGVAGMFECTSNAACAAQNGPDGQLNSLTGTWTFTPTSTDSMVADVRTDADYLDFGYWVNTDDSGDDTEYMVNTFHRGEDPYVGVADVEGSATYKGDAAGLYTKRALTPRGDGDATAAGRFTADAELTAHFSGNDVAMNDQNSISGTIKNFMDGGTMIDAAWLVELNDTGETPNVDETAGTFSGKTTGDGSWNGTFYGDGDNAYPSGVAASSTPGSTTAT